MQLLTPQLTQIMATLTLLSDLAAVGLVVYFSYLYFNQKKIFLKNPLVKFFHKNAYLLAFIVTLSATLGSLFYSEIAEYAPCKLCWYQRVFMYPLVPLLGLALWQGQKKITDHILVLSLIGTLIAAYHYALQQSASPLTPCSATAETISCSDYFTISYGYITIPMMTLTAFGLILLLMLFEKKVTSLTKNQP